jgi:hypothetical protein
MSGMVIIAVLVGLGVIAAAVLLWLLTHPLD